MKKSIIIFTLLALCTMVSAQTYHVVYIPGDGERQFGFNLAPTFCAQHLNVYATNVDAADKSFNYTVDGTVNNLVGFNAGIFYGYETTWGNFIEWGNYTSLFYSINPFVGDVTFTHDGISETHKINHNVQHVILHVNPFISHRINEEFSVSLGLGVSLAPRLSAKTKVDGQVFTEEKDFESSILQNFFNISFDANASVKYWFSDEWYVGLRMQYNFANLASIFSKIDESDDVWDVANGNLKLNLDKKTVKPVLLGKNSIQAVFAIGYCW